MFQSFPLGRLFGITIKVHGLFLVMLLVLMVVAPRYGMLLPILFGCVLLHELGHGLVAQRFGIRVLDITLWPLGGMARMSTIPESPRIEALIAIAGPAVNFALAALSVPLLFLPGPVALFAQFFLAVNLLMGLFNLVPAFPMDGGRLLRAYLGRGRDWVSATELAVRVGRVFAIAMLLAWPFMHFNVVLPLIALFIWFTGRQELYGVRLRHGYSPFGSFGDRSKPFPGFRGFGPRPEPPRPQPGPSFGGGFGPFGGAGAPQPSGGGFSDEDIERMERFPGSLRR